jgi:uncharacterized membrane protein
MAAVNDERTPMTLKRLATRRTLVIGAVALAVVVGCGAAIAATKAVVDPEAEREAFQAAVAEKLGVTTAELENAYQEAALEQLDAAVEAGRLTKEQADAIRDRIESGDVFGPHLFFGDHPHGGPGLHGPPLDGAADYLGLTETELHEQLRAGKSLAEIAKAEGKSVDGLKDALLADAKERLDQVVEDGRLTAAQRDEMLERLESKIDDLVNGTPPADRGHPFGQRFGGPPMGHMDAAFPPDA